MSKARLGVIKFGQLSKWGQKMNMGDEETFYAKSGRWVYNNSGVIDAATNGINAILGFVNFIGVCGDADGKTKLSINTSEEVWVEMPIYRGTELTQATLDALIGKACDLYVSTLQYANLTDSTTDYLFEIMGGSVADQTVYVRKLPPQASDTYSASV